MEFKEFWELFTTRDEVNLIFLCMGNVCRSPYAEIKFEQLLGQSTAPVANKIKIKSGGFINQIDVQIHPFTKRALLEEGVEEGRISRHFPRNMRKFKEELLMADALIVMSKSNRDILLPMKYRPKALLLSAIADHGTETDIPDPALYKDYAQYKGVMDQIKSYLENFIAGLQVLPPVGE